MGVQTSDFESQVNLNLGKNVEGTEVKSIKLSARTGRRTSMRKKIIRNNFLARQACSLNRDCAKAEEFDMT